MKEDKLKRFVNDNRDDFEQHSHDYDEIWNDISHSLDQKHRWHGFKIIRNIAASLLILIVAGFIILKFTASENRTISGHKSLPADLVEAAYFYEGMINDKLEIVNANASEIDPDIFSDLNALDSAYQELFDDLKDNADNEEVVSAMIQNYKIKLEILESILMEIKPDEENNNDNEKSDKAISI